MSTRYLVELVPAGEEFMFYARQVERRAVERTPVINPSADAVAAWVVFAGDGTAAEAAVARHLYLLSRGDGPDPLVAQVHPAAEPEPARVVDGLTVGARYRLHGRDARSADEPDIVTFGGKNASYYWFSDHRSRYLHENDAASGAVVIADLDGNRVDYWAEQARRLIDLVAASYVPDGDDTPVDGNGRHAHYDAAVRDLFASPAVIPDAVLAEFGVDVRVALNALPRVLDEQESTR